MPVNISMKLDTSKMDGFIKDYKAKLKKAVGKAMSTEAKGMKSAIRAQVSGAMKVEKQAFLNSFGAKVVGGFDMPAIRAGTKIRWAGIHETGGTINGMMLIPLYGRISAKRLRSIIVELMRSGNAFFVKGKGGKVILMAENIAENAKPLAGLKRRYRKAEGIKRLKRGVAVPIAMLVPRVTLPKRLDVEKLVMGRVPALMQSIGKEIGGIR